MRSPSAPHRLSDRWPAWSFLLLANVLLGLEQIVRLLHMSSNVLCETRGRSCADAAARHWPQTFALSHCTRLSNKTEGSDSDAEPFFVVLSGTQCSTSIPIQSIKNQM